MLAKSHKSFIKHKYSLCGNEWTAMLFFIYGDSKAVKSRRREGQVHGHLNINKFLIFIFSVINPLYLFKKKTIWNECSSIDHWRRANFIHYIVLCCAFIVDLKKYIFFWFVFLSDEGFPRIYEVDKSKNMMNKLAILLLIGY